MSPSIIRNLPRRKVLSRDDYIRGFQAGNRAILSQAITLVESNAAAHEALAQEVLQQLLPKTGKAIRVGITGVPGAGKSTIIEALGEMLCAKGHKVAVLAVDPSSTLTRGSILGDKTRMEELSRNPSAFIRPSPNAGNLGGVSRKSRETLLLCEAFGFDIILVETVGVGQSEVTVRSMVDFFMLVQIAGAGDELQGIKKGVIELADAITVNKADGDNLQPARKALAEYQRILPLLQPATRGWTPRAMTASALSGDGIPQLWECIEEFVDYAKQSGIGKERRRHQNAEWFDSLLLEAIRRKFFDDPNLRQKTSDLRNQVAKGSIPAASAVLEAMG